MDEPTTPIGDAETRLRSSLHAAADSLGLEPVDAAAVRRRATHRRRRRTAVVGAGALAAVVAVGAVVANRDRGDDTLELSAPTETTRPTEPTEPKADDAATSATTPITTPITTPATLPPIAPTVAADSAFDGAEISAARTSGGQQLLPWRDGFLLIGVEYRPQPLPELPEEISALFPEEVTALFPDGLPSTIDEATEILSEAGLLDEVMEVLAAHPEASEAIYATPPPPPTLRASFTTDGREWRSIELDSPTTYPGQFAVSGDRLITWTTEYDEQTGPDVRGPVPTRFVLAWTDDLTSWETTEMAFDPAAAISDDFVRTDTFVNSVAVVGDRWVAQIERHRWFDVESALPADVRAELTATSGGYGMSTDDDGVLIEFYDEENRTGERRFTWEELGLAGSPERGLDGGRPSITMVAGRLGGPTQDVVLPAGEEWPTLFAADGGFLLAGERLWESADGVSWSEVAGAPGGFLNTVVPLRTGTLLIQDGEDGPTGFLRDAAGTLREVALPQLPQRYWLWNQNGSSAWVVELYDEGAQPGNWEPVTVTVEHDGRVLALTEGPDGTSYVLTDAATGSIVAEADWTYGDDELPELWEYDEETETATFVVFDTAGNEVDRIPGELFEAAYAEAYEGVEATSEPAVEEPATTPDLWLVATLNGVDWLTVDLPDREPDAEYWPQTAAVNGGRVLYQMGDEFVLANLPTSG